MHRFVVALIVAVLAGGIGSGYKLLTDEDPAIQRTRNAAYAALKHGLDDLADGNAPIGRWTKTEIAGREYIVNRLPDSFFGDRRWSIVGIAREGGASASATATFTEQYSYINMDHGSLLISDTDPPAQP